MGFSLLSEGEQPILERPMHDELDQAAPSAPEDAEIVGAEIDVQHADMDGVEIQGKLVLSPDGGDHINVNGVEIYKDTALATMREACSFFQISTSGGKKPALRDFGIFRSVWNCRQP